jgi:hypothetical protein
MIAMNADCMAAARWRRLPWIKSISYLSLKPPRGSRFGKHDPYLNRATVEMQPVAKKPAFRR